MPRRHDEYLQEPRNPEQSNRQQPERQPGEEPDFESRVSEAGTDPDTMFDENLNPTDEPRRSER